MINHEEELIMEDYTPSSTMLPIHNIIKSHLVICQHSNEKLCPQVISALSLKITETIESFLNNAFKEKTHC
jgi:hypothetical protein